MERNRIVYFDCLRILAMCFVIYMHVASLPLSMERDNEWILLTLVTSVAYTIVAQLSRQKSKIFIMN